MVSDERLKNLQELKERDLTKNYIIPLFKCLHNTTVEDYHGPSERGKDLVCWGKNAIGDTQLIVAQIKRYKPTGDASSSSSFTTIVNQLSQARVEPLPFNDGKRYRPEIVYFITPYEVDTSVLLSHFDKVESLKPLGVRIIDGPKLLTLLDEHLPHLSSALGGIKYALSRVIEPTLTNELLLRALQFPRERKVDTFFTSLDVFLGKPSDAEALYASFFPGRKRFIIVGLEDWLKLQEIDRICKTKYGCSVFTDPSGEHEKLVELRSSAHKEWQTEYKEALNSYTDAQRALTDMRHRVESQTRSAQQTFQTREEIDPKDAKKLEKALIEESEKDLDDAERIYKRYKEDLEDIKRQEPKLNIEIVLAGHALAVSLRSALEAIKKSCAQFNQSTPRAVDTKQLLKDANELFADYKYISRGPGIREILGIRAKEELQRLKVPAHILFDSKENLTVLGEAGAGKTTMLQMYALRAYEQKSQKGDTRLVIFIPLAKMVRCWQSAGLTHHEGTDVPELEVGLSLYFKDFDIGISKIELTEELSRTGGVVLLDGMDEVFTNAPWIIESVDNFIKRFPKIQIVITSRISGSFIESLSFPSITLAPFTKPQRTTFVRKWFGAGNEKRSLSVLKHLSQNEEISNIASNPLLATILCVLAIYEIPLPNREIRLYDERLKLFTGHYDFIKDLDRLKTHSRDLEAICYHLAFRLHSDKAIEATKNTLLKWTREISNIFLNADQLKNALRELIDPCNLLVVMSEGKYGFGHLRFQEHLAATHIQRNRSIDIAALMRDEWWRDVFVLYGSMIHDFQGFLKSLSDTGALSFSIMTVRAMVTKLPPLQREQAIEYLRKKGYE